jgi:hypothetical protein
VRTIRNTQIVRTSQETHYVSATETNRLMLFRETVAVYCENHTEHTQDSLWHNKNITYIQPGGAYSYHCVLKV